MTEITLSCGHTVTTDDLEHVVCEICNASKEVSNEVTEAIAKLPEYMKVINEITTEFKKVNPKIKQVIYQDVNGLVHCKFIEKARFFMKFFHSEQAFEYEIKNITKQPIQELKNILDIVKSKGSIAKEFRKIFGKSSLRFVTDELFSTLYHDGKKFLFNECSVKKQKGYVWLGGGSGAILLALLGVVIGIL